MAFANFGILQAMPDPYERIRQASQGWGALPGVVGGIQQKWAEEKLKDVHGRVLGAWDFQHEADTNPAYRFASPEEKAQYDANRAIFGAKDTDSQKFRKAAQLYSPYDGRLTEKMLGMADVRDREEAQLQDQMNQRIAQQKAKEAEAEAEQPYKNMVRADSMLAYYGRAIDQLRNTPIPATDRVALENRERQIADLVKKQGVVAEAQKAYASKNPELGMMFAPAPVEAPAVGGVAPVVSQPAPAVESPKIMLKSSKDLSRAELAIDQQMGAGLFDKNEADRRKGVLKVEAEELARTEGAVAGAKAKGQAEEQKRLGVLVGSAKILGENSVMMGSVDKIASGNMGDLSVEAMLAALPVENSRMVGGLSEKDATLLNTLRGYIGTDKEYTEEDRDTLIDIAKRVQSGYMAKLSRLRSEWGKLSPAQQEQVLMDFPAFVPPSKDGPAKTEKTNEIAVGTEMLRGDQPYVWNGKNWEKKR